MIMMDWLFEPARIEFCERAVPGPIKHPADTWTNISPLVAGLYILMRSATPLQRLLGVAAGWTAVASAMFHASGMLWGEVLDLSGMFLFILTIAALQQRRGYLASRELPRRTWPVYIAGNAFPGSNRYLIPLVITFTVLLTCLSAWSVVFASPTFALLVLFVLVRELLSPFRLARWGLWLVVLLAISRVFWWVDYAGVLCHPSNHLLTGHGVWHLLSGFIFYCAFLHFTEDQMSRK